MAPAAPKLAIGLPVYNGERYVGEALGSLLGQTFGDFVLYISDNASTDRTEEICRSFAARDNRVRYCRSPRNVGAAPNFNRVWKLARPLGTPYFKWAAADDIVEPTYLEKCLTALEADPGAVLAHSRAAIIDPQGNQLIPHDVGCDGFNDDRVKGRPAIPTPGLTSAAILDPTRRTNDPDVATRLEDIFVRTRWCFEQFGVIRSDTINASPLHLSFYGSDKVLLAAFGLRGRFIEVPEPLFLRRYHTGQSSSKSFRELAIWMDATRGARRPPPQVECFRWYLRLINRSPYGLWDKTRCYGKVGHWAAWLTSLIYHERHEKGLLFRVREVVRSSVYG